LGWLIAGIKKIGIHGLLAYLATFAGLILAMLCILVIPGAGQTSTVIGKLLDAPFWLSQLVCGAVAGWALRRRLRISGYGYALVIPFLLLVLDIVIEGVPMRKWTPLSDVYFSSNSGDTEGVYKLMFVVPVYTAIAYVMGAGVTQLAGIRSQSAKSQVRPPVPS
jgi:hypothetical protein